MRQRPWQYTARSCTFEQYQSYALKPDASVQGSEAGDHVSNARWDLCEGCRATGIPIATNFPN